MPYVLSLEDAQKLLPSVEILEAFPSSGQKAAFKAKVADDIYALKIYDPECSIERVQREIRAMTMVDSPYVVKFKELRLIVTRDQTITYTIEEFIEGEDLKSKLKKGYIMSEEENIEFLEKLLEGLVEIKRHKLVHRDIKPGNIIVRNDGNPVIIDFGIARHLDLASVTGTHLPVGPCTYPYASPEQLENKKDLIDCRCDLYGLGFIAYECLTGSHPYWEDSDSFEANIRRMLDAPIPEISGISKELYRFIKKLLQRKIYLRFPSPEIALEVLRELKEEL